MKKLKLNPTVIIVFTVVTFFVMSTIDTIREVLHREIFVNVFIFINGYTFFHVLLFFVIALYYPNKWLWILAGMIAFEYIEFVVATTRPPDIIKFWNPVISTIDTINDILFNLFGYWIGHKYLKNRQ